jgi:chloramphenicol 3-O phosphotransferase
VDVGHYDVGVLRECAHRLAGLPVLFVGVRCPIEVIMARRGLPGEAAPTPVLRWQREAHEHWAYDIELDTSVLGPQECAEAIRKRLEGGAAPTAFARLAER